MRGEAAAVRRNKHGQALGRKGAESRRRLLDAACKLLEDRSAKLTPSAVARSAGLTSQTFYLYFADINELLLTLSEEASTDVGRILRALEDPWDPGAIDEHSRRFIDAIYDFWDGHRAVLSFRNFQSDLGDEAFVHVRFETSRPIISLMAKRIRSARGEDQLSEADALARAVIIYAAIERLAARPPTMRTPYRRLEESDLRRAEADILTLLFTRAD
jgi:AcrR family transcriptional regulator